MPAIRRRPPRLAISRAVEHSLRSLGWGRFAVVGRALLHLRAHARSFARVTDDAKLRQAKRTLLIAGALHSEIRAAFGEARADAIVHTLLERVATVLQSSIYLARPLAERTWDALHEAHDEVLTVGFARVNEHVPIESSGSLVSFEITRCRLVEALRDMGAARVAEAFCRSDEIVFGQYAPGIRFHRGTGTPDTIARGAATCRFVFERGLASRPLASQPVRSR